MAISTDSLTFTTSRIEWHIPNSLNVYVHVRMSLRDVMRVYQSIRHGNRNGAKWTGMQRHPLELFVCSLKDLWWLSIKLDLYTLALIIHNVK